MTEQKAIYDEVSSLLVKLFEVDPQDIKPEARLYEIWNSTASTQST